MMKSRHQFGEQGGSLAGLSLAAQPAILAPDSAHFYSKLMTNRNSCNSLKTNDRCAFYSKLNRGGIRR
jgi:hypothetical protein